MPSKTSKQQRFFRAVKRAKHDPNYGSKRLHKVANSMSDSDIDDFANHLAEMKIKKALLATLKEIQEDIAIREPMYLDEEDESQAGVDAVSDQFTVKENWAKYIGKYVGQPLSKRELDAIENFKEKSPITTSRTELWYKTKDNMNISHTTLIRKMRDGGQFSYISFQRQKMPESPEDVKAREKMSNANSTGAPFEPPIGGGPLSPEIVPPRGMEEPETPTATPPEQQIKAKEKAEAKETILVTKSILFKDDIKGAAVLLGFLKELDL